jgi:hypothetical protein
MSSTLSKLEEGVKNIEKMIISEKNYCKKHISALEKILKFKNDEYIEATNDETSKVMAILKTFLEEEKGKCKLAAQKIKEMIEDFENLCIYVGAVDNSTNLQLGTKSPTPEIVFGQIINFVKSIEKATAYAENKIKRSMKAT